MSSLTEIAEIILASAKLLDAHTTSQNLPPTSFDNDTLSNLPIELEAARKSITDATQTLKHLAMGPASHVFEISLGCCDLLALRAIYHFDLAQLVPLEGEISFQDIAAKCNPKLDEGRLKRFLQMGMANNIFQEKRAGYVSHTVASRLLRDDAGFRANLGMHFSEVHPALNHMIEAIETFGPSEEPNKTGFQIAYQTSDVVYTEIYKHPERAKMFGEAMTFFSSQSSYDTRHIASGYNWSQFAGGTAVDVGGGHGSVSKAFTSAFPEINFIVQDLPETIRQVGKSLSKSSGDSQNPTYMAHDFFTPQPVKGAEVYFFRWIFHNWADKYCVDILKNLVPALKKGSRILLFEYLLPETGETSWSEKGYPGARNLDMFMMAGWNARERSTKIFEGLFTLADAGFRFVGASTPPGSSMSIIEAVWE